MLNQAFILLYILCKNLLFLCAEHHYPLVIDLFLFKQQLPTAARRPPRAQRHVGPAPPHDHQVDHARLPARLLPPARLLRPPAHRGQGLHAPVRVRPVRGGAAARAGGANVSGRQRQRRQHSAQGQQLHAHHLPRPELQGQEVGRVQSE